MALQLAGSTAIVGFSVYEPPASRQRQPKHGASHEVPNGNVRNGLLGG